MNTVNKEINKLVAEGKGGYVYASYYRVVVSENIPPRFVSPYYEVRGGKVWKVEKDYINNCNITEEMKPITAPAGE